MLRIAEVDHAGVERTLAEFEAMLDQSDLRPVYARLRAEQSARKAGAKAGRRAESDDSRQAARQLSY